MQDPTNKLRLMHSIESLKKLFGTETRKKVMYHTGADINNPIYVLKNSDLYKAIVDFYESQKRSYLLQTDLVTKDERLSYAR